MKYYNDLVDVEFAIGKDLDMIYKKYNDKVCIQIGEAFFGFKRPSTRSFCYFLFENYHGSLVYELND